MRPSEPPNDCCLTCGEALSEDAAEGLCPRCLFALGAEETGPARGRVLEGYEIFEEIGRGGAGVVFRALQLSLNRPVALKLLLNARLLSRSEVEHFRSEAETVGQLRHPNIVSVHEVGEEKGQPWFSMDLVDGPDLAREIRERPLSSLRAAQIARKIARAVEYAHQRKILHLDIKPSNVVLDSTGEPQITDFGLASTMSASGQGSNSRMSRGTPSYMAPEQVNSTGLTLTPATDVWALGALLYHLICGRPPFVGSTAAETAEHVLTMEPINPRVLNPSVPKDLETVCLKCLRKSPAARYSSAAELAEELERFESGVPVRARPIPPAEKMVRWARRQPVLAALGCALFIALLGWLVATDRARRTALQAANAAKTAAQEKQRLLTRQYIARAFEALADRAEVRALPWLIAAWQNDPQSGLSSRDDAHAMRVAGALAAVPQLSALFRFSSYATSVGLSERGDLACAGSEDRRVLVWSTRTGARLSEWMEDAPIVRVRLTRDGMKVVTAAAPGRPSTEPDNLSSVAVRNASDGTLLREWKVAGKVRSIELSNDDRYVAVASSSGLVEVWDVETGERAAPEMKHAGDARMAVFSPNAEILVTCSFDGTARIWNWRRGELQRELKHRSLVRDVRVSPDGRKIVTACGDGVAWLWDLQHESTSGVPMRHKSTVYGVAFSEDGSMIGTASSDSTARIWNSATGEPISSPLHHPHRVTRLAFSPDGKFLLTSTSEGLLTVWETATHERQYSLTQTGQTEEIAWLRSGKGFVSADGSGLVRQWMLPKADRWAIGRNFGQTANFLAISPQANQLLVGFDRGQALLWKWDEAREPVEFLHDRAVVSGGFFRGTTNFWTSTRRGPLQIRNAEHGKEVQSIAFSGALRSVEVSPADDDIAICTENGECTVWELGADAPEKVLRFGGLPSRCTWSPDGLRFAIAWYEPQPKEPREGGFSIRVWRKSDFKLELEGLRFQGEPLDLQFGKDKALLAVSTSLGMSHLVDVKSGRVLFSLRQPGEVRSVGFGAGDQSLLTAGAQGVVRIWDTISGQLLTSSLSQGGMSRARFSKDGRWILTWGRDLRAQLWDATSFEPILPPQFHDDAIVGAGISSDQQWVVTAGADDFVRLWPVRRPALTLAEADRQARVISGHAVDPTGAVVALAPDEIAQLWGAAPNSALPP